MWGGDHQFSRPFSSFYGKSRMEGERSDPGNRALLLLLSSWFSSILSSSVAAFFGKGPRLILKSGGGGWGGKGMFSRQFLCLIESSVRPPKESSRPFFARIWAPLASTKRKAEREIACHGRERDISPEPPEKSTRISPMRILGALSRPTGAAGRKKWRKLFVWRARVLFPPKSSAPPPNKRRRRRL